MIDFSDVEQAWKEFIDKQTINPNLAPFLANSWRRSWAHINLGQELSIPRLTPQNLLTIQIANFDLLSVVRPIMEDTYQCIEQTDTIIMLVNGAGYVLDFIGDPEMIKRLERLGISHGSLLSEEQVGTNAFGLALIDQMPVRVIGPEHYRREFHPLAGVATPIFDLSGHPLGAFGLFTLTGNYHPHSLGLVTAGARAIEGQKQSDTFLEEQNSQLTQLNAILSSINEGIIVWNSEGTLIHVNAAASHILEYTADAMVGKQIDQLISIPQFMKDAIKHQEKVKDVEASIGVDAHTVHCFVSLHFVFTKNNEVKWGIATLRTEKDVRKLVQHQVGANAALTVDDIPGDSLQMQRVKKFVHSAAGAEASILIRGEVGTGKNVLANAIHNASQRRDGPFVIFACSSIPNELVVSELLGFDESISSSGARSRPSKFELAQSGTFYFQDIDALPLEAQAVLLNMLEMKFVQRLGSRRPIDVDVRVIASTHANMEVLIAQGSFRSDLFYQLSTFTITLPALRDRPNDIPLVVDRILNRLARQLGYSLRLGPGVIDILKKCPWPGNVRELESALGRAAMQVGSTGVIERSHLPSTIFYPLTSNESNWPVTPIQPLYQLERETILKTAQLCHGNVTQMARALGTSRSTMWRKLKEFSIQPDNYRPHQPL